MRLFWIRIPQPFEAALGQCRKHFLLVAFFSALINLLYLAPTIYMMQVYDRVVPTGGVITLYVLTLLVGAAIAILSALDAVRSRLMLRASIRLDRLLSAAVMARALAPPDERPSAQALRDFDSVRSALSGPGITAMFDAPWAPLYLLVAFLIHPLLGLMVLLGAGLLIMLAILNERANRLSGSQAHSAQAKAYAEQDATFRGAEVVRALGMGTALIARHSEQRRSGLVAAFDVQLTSGRFTALVKFVRMFMQSLALGVGAWLAINNQISVGAIIAASVLLSRALQPVEQMVGSWPALSQAHQSLASLDRLFATTGSNEEHRLALPEPTGNLQIAGISVFAANGEVPILRNVSFGLKPGTLTGVVGPSGAGKTTLARAAAGCIIPDTGELRMDGARYADWHPERLARYIGYLPQQPTLLPGTVADNISRFSRPSCGTDQEVVDHDIVHAAQMAGVHDTILRLPAGYQTRIGDGAEVLSAGQAQRIALARALFGSPKVLILDEPNSALDAEGESALGRAVKAACLQGAAVMMIAHRAQILAAAENLVVMNAGTVVKHGPRADVLDELARDAARSNVVPLTERA
ncbi:type I secretion system permease/ATPase [Sphingomonas sp. LHG3406-1]|uniref:type I secretion system permease/ATPase n=1 Tax=Sphingomonas sp. LHG3406-1 TaxID=2804617 RepID=UPI002601AD6B|nr:type I secretion system permease/ATPase [Sphingomonas sp. LHG3406-1]